MFACSCASPACQVNGCQIANEYRQRYAKDLLSRHPTRPEEQLPGRVLTEDRIRQIIREEINRAKENNNV